MTYIFNGFLNALFSVEAAKRVTGATVRSEVVDNIRKITGGRIMRIIKARSGRGIKETSLIISGRARRTFAIRTTNRSRRSTYKAIKGSKTVGDGRMKSQ